MSHIRSRHISETTKGYIHSKSTWYRNTMGSLDRKLIPELCRTEIKETSVLLCKEMVWTHPNLPETFPDYFNGLETI